jgi:hypothetical protein
MLADWTAIAPSPDSGVFNVLRADSSHPLDFRIGRDSRGRFVFQLDAEGDPADAAPADPPAGMDVLIDDLGKGATRLTLLLHDREDFEIFRVLCADLLEVTRGYARDEALRAMRILLGRLRQWQEVLARRRQRLLSRNEIVGLVGELLFLRDLLVPRLGLPLAIGTWRGPYGDEQDFALGDTIVEVKTQGTTADRRIQISSEDQLDTSSSRIVLCQQGIAACPPEDDEGVSLNGLASALLEVSSAAPDARARLQLGLDTAGWHEHPEYDDVWKLVDRNYFEVADGFPRIVRSDLRAGVENVRYQVRVADCLSFRINEANLFTGSGE